MSIEALYPSRRFQSHANNPLFARERRLRRLSIMVAVIGALSSLAVLQVMPFDAEAHNAPAEVVSAPALPVPLAATPRKAVRIIPLYGAAPAGCSAGEAR